MPDWGSLEGGGGEARVPLAGMLFDPALRPTLTAIADGAATGAYAVVNQNAKRGHAELMRDGLGFDCRGLAPGGELRCSPALHAVALPGDEPLDAWSMVTLGPVAHLAGAASLLPVVRMLCGLMLALAELPGLRAVAWLPARLAVSPTWFARNVAPWLDGGPFPALALTALSRGDGAIASQGLAFFTGQEFSLTRRDGTLRDSDTRGAVRLIDWLVANGRIEQPCEAELVGFGSIMIEPASRNSLNATIL